MAEFNCDASLHGRWQVLRRAIEDSAQFQRQRGRGEWFLQERNARIQHSLMDAAFSVYAEVTSGLV